MNSYHGILYHGSSKRFNSFDLSFAGSSRNYGYYGIGVYLARYSLARSYAFSHSNDNDDIFIYKVLVNLCNISNFQELEDVCSIELPSQSKVKSKLIRHKMLDAGFDSARILTTLGEEFVVYDPVSLSICDVSSVREFGSQSPYEYNSY